MNRLTPSATARWMRSAAQVFFVSALAVLGLAAPGAAQVSVVPAAVEVSVPVGQQAEVTVEVANSGAEGLSLFAVPLPEGGAPDDVGALLFHTEPKTADDPQGMTMTPSGRLFAAKYGGFISTFEYTADLALIREYDSPGTSFTSNTTGLAWMPPDHAPPGHPEGTLWWLDLDTDCFQGVCTVVTTLAIEGDLDGNETGRTVALTTGPGVSDEPSFDRGLPFGLSYDPEIIGPSGAPGLFYYTDIINESFYAVDVAGTVAEGYPAPLTDYDLGGQRSLYLNSTVDATRGPDGGEYLEVGFVIDGDTQFERVVVADRDGRSTGVETPLGGLGQPSGEGELFVMSSVLRSSLDPSVMYLAVESDGGEFGFGVWIYAIRAAPLPPRWLRASAVAPAPLELEPGATDALTVRLDTEGLEVGSYAGLIELRRDGPNGDVVADIPVALTVTDGTSAEESAASPKPSLTVYPNPVRSAGGATVALALVEPSEASVVVYDVLGREVAVMHDGPLPAGNQRLALDVAVLPAGVYVVRAVGAGFRIAQRFTVAR